LELIKCSRHKHTNKWKSTHEINKVVVFVLKKVNGVKKRSKTKANPIKPNCLK
jgi:hypothetical protein